MTKASPYLTINIVFILILGIGFAYSWFFFPDTHPIDCYIKQKTGKDCPSCGISRAFSCFTHGLMEEGKKFNGRALPIFLFFLIQFSYRLGLVVFQLSYRKKITPSVIYTDVLISVLHFLYAFLPMFK